MFWAVLALASVCSGQTIRNRATFVASDYNQGSTFDTNTAITGALGDCKVGNRISVYWSIVGAFIEVMMVSEDNAGYVSVGWCEQGTYTPMRAEVAQRCTYVTGSIRSADGRVWTWTGREVRPGAGPAESSLAFDRLERR